ncbi:hypothetical protein BDQ17DRAFT_1234391 [Cyathus striatus]|nr:hypothetical protein BDQ17DRAFT_1234391 [Cyathus striatus]
MSTSNVITTTSHGSGPTCLAFSKDGLRAFTGGQDCIVRIWKMDEGVEQEPQTAAEAEAAITSVAVANDYWLSSSEDFEVRRYFKDTTDYDSSVTAAVGVPVRSVAIDSKGKWVAVASDELVVKLINMEDITDVHRLEGYKRGVRRVTWHPSGALLSTCDSDGKITMWDITGEQPRIEKVIEGVIPTITDQESSEFSYDCSVVWHTSGQHFYAPSRSHEIVAISRSSWNETSKFSDNSVFGAVTALAISANGLYLTSASHSKVHVWSTQTRRLIASHPASPGSTVTQLAFSPRENLLAWTDTEGAFTRWMKPVPSDSPDPAKPFTAINGALSKQKVGLDLFNDGEDATKSKDPTDEFDDIHLDDEAIFDDFIEDDLGNGAFTDEPVKERNAGFVKEMVSITKAQLPFQPGSTPMINKRQYLAYNMIGVIEVTDQDTHHVVNVEFFDKTLRKGYHFTDHFKYDLAYLGDRGAVFACQPENEHPAQVLFRPYSSWSAQKEWVYPLKRTGTRVLGVAAGSLPLSGKNVDNDLQGFGNVAVATSEGDLTFLSGTGRERRIIGLGGDYVTMVASVEWVFVVYRAGSTTIDGSQNLSYILINFSDFSVRQRDSLPVAKGHTLKWIGVTDQGAPTMYDTTGCVHILTKYRIPHHAAWARVLDTNLLERRQGKDETYWPVGITGSTFMCLILKGRQEYPSFPRPLMQELPLRIPFRGGDPKEETVERELLLKEIALDSLDEELTTDEIASRERAIDKEFIILIQAACKSDNIPRAIELTKLLHYTTAFDAASKIADFYHLVGFKEKVEMLKAEREEAEDRMIAARNKRKRWLKPDTQIREIAPATSARSSRLDPLSDVRPPPPIERPGMARVTVPVIEKSRYSSVAPSPSLTPSRSSEDEQTLTESPVSIEIKRKRSDLDDPSGIPDLSMPPPKQINPFARKANPETSKNPFSRKVENKTIRKSESFFEKVEAAESEPAKSKKSTNKSNDKDGPRQTTLFGMMAKVPKKTKAKDTIDDEELAAPESQMDIDVEMQEDSQATTDGWEESQSTSETQDTAVVRVAKS